MNDNFVVNDANVATNSQPENQVIDFLTIEEPSPTLESQNYDDNSYEYVEDKKKRNKLLLIVLLLLLLLGLGGFFGYKWYQEKRYDDWLERIRDAAREHVDHDQDVKDNVIIGKQDKVVIKDIISDGYLVTDDLINPKTGKQISACNFVKLAVQGGIISYLEVTINNETCPGGKPIIVLKGSKEVRIVVGNTYKDAGANAYDEDGSDISRLIETTNNVDNLVVGQYLVNYNLTNAQGIKAEEVVRTVIVEQKTNGKPQPVIVGDRTRPSINMLGLSATIKVGETLNYSMIFSDNVQLKKIIYCTPDCKTENVAIKSLKRSFKFVGSKVGTYNIKATAYDKSGNMLTLTRTITVTGVLDKKAPTVTLVSNPNEIQQGESAVVTIRFEDNVGIQKYSACVGTTCVDGTLTTPRQIVIVPIEVTPTEVGELQITAMARDTSNNFFPHSRIGILRVIAGEVSNATVPRVTLVDAPASGIVGQPLNITVKYEGVAPQKISKYKLCAQLGGINNCTEGIINPPLTEKIIVHQYIPTKPGTYRFTAMGINVAGQYSGNIYLKDIIVK